VKAVLSGNIDHGGLGAQGHPVNYAQDITIGAVKSV
jgi:hypothetical protein